MVRNLKTLKRLPYCPTRSCRKIGQPLLSSTMAKHAASRIGIAGINKIDAIKTSVIRLRKVSQPAISEEPISNIGMSFIKYILVEVAMMLYKLGMMR